MQKQDRAWVLGAGSLGSLFHQQLQTLGEQHPFSASRCLYLSHKSLTLVQTYSSGNSNPSYFTDKVKTHTHLNAKRANRDQCEVHICRAEQKVMEINDMPSFKCALNPNFRFINILIKLGESYQSAKFTAKQKIKFWFSGMSQKNKTLPLPPSLT